MSLENSNSKGKAVVKEEEVSPASPVDQKPFAVMSNQDGKAAVPKEEEDPLPPTPATAPPPPATTPPHLQQTPLNNVSGSRNDGNRGVRVHGVGSSAAAPPPSAAHMMQQAAMQRGLVAAPTPIFPAFKQLDSSRILFIKQVLQHCVTALTMGDVVAANTALVILSTLASATGDPLQRVAFAFAEALGRRAVQKMLPGLFGGLLQLEPPRAPAAVAGYTGATRLCFDSLCPFLRVAASVANHEIMTAMAGEKHVHVLDLGGASPNQWLELLHLLAVRPAGKPSSLRLTVVSKEEGLLACIAWLLQWEAVRLRIPFIFNPVRSHVDRLSLPDIASFGVQPGVALAISSTLQLHRLIADVRSVELPAGPGVAADHGNKGKGKKKQKTTKQEITMADALLRVLCDLSPKVMVLTEQEAYHNVASLGDRVRNAFDYYAALFDDLEAGGAARESADRAALERVLLREEIMDIVARDGSARRERHESMMAWARRMGAAGFRPMSLPVWRFDAFADPELLARQLSIHGTLRYWVAQDNTCFLIYANMTPMFSVTAWQPATATGGQ